MKPRKRLFIFSILAPIVTALFWLVSTSRAAYETPLYEVVRSERDFEVRDYAPMTLARTQMAGEGKDNSFMRLFRFIDGGNERSQKIAMTSPVLIEETAENRTMSFVVPRKVAEGGVPKPSGDKVTLAKSDGGRFAVFRFSGGRDAANESAALAKLKQWLEAQKIHSAGSPRFAYYDPPWTPTFMRRNEVMIAVERK